VTFARSLARRIPFPRDLAAAALWHDVGALVRGQPPAGLSLEEARIRHDLARCRRLLARGHAEAAIEVADAALAATPANTPLLRLKVDAEVAAGRSRAALSTIRKLRRGQDSPALAMQELRLAGSTLVDETDWVPELPPAQPCADPEGPSLVLVAETAWRTRRRSTWVDDILVAIARADLRPVVMLAPGVRLDPSDASLTQVRSDLVRWIPTDLGPSYPVDPPADRAALDFAWAAAAAARSIGPARIVALVVGDAGGLSAGISLRGTVGCPLAAVISTSAGSVAWPGTSARRLDRVDRIIEAPDPADAALLPALRAIGDLGASRRVGA
jgi:hypothetical protein